MLEQFPEGLVAVVSDSYDVYNAVTNIWGDRLRDKVLRRNGCLVIRPDSGDPQKVVPDLLDAAGKAFGFTVNEKGYRVLPSQIRMIQGDGISRHTLKGISDAVMDKGWSADNLTFGSGGGLLQQCNRDTQRFAFKCSAVKRERCWYDVWKKPVTDPTKDSKRGLLSLVKRDDSFVTISEECCRLDEHDYLLTVFHNGIPLYKNGTFSNIRQRARLNW